MVRTNKRTKLTEILKNREIPCRCCGFNYAIILYCTVDCQRKKELKEEQHLVIKKKYKRKNKWNNNKGIYEHDKQKNSNFKYT